MQSGSKRKLDSTGQPQSPFLFLSSSSAPSSWPPLSSSSALSSSAPSADGHYLPLPYPTPPSMTLSPPHSLAFTDVEADTIKKTKTKPGLPDFTWKGHTIGRTFKQIDKAIQTYTTSEEEAAQFIRDWSKACPKNAAWGPALMKQHAPHKLMEELTASLPPSVIIPGASISMKNITDEQLSTLIQDGKDSFDIVFTSKNAPADGHSLEEVKTETSKITVKALKSLFRLQSNLVAAQELEPWKDSLSNKITLPAEMVFSKKAVEEFISLVYNQHNLLKLMKTNLELVAEIAALCEYFQCSDLTKLICQTIETDFDDSKPSFLVEIIGLEKMFKEYKKLLATPYLNLEVEKAFLNSIKKMAIRFVKEDSIVDLDEEPLTRLLSAVVLSEERKLQLIKHWCDQHQKTNADRIRLARTLTQPAAYMPLRSAAGNLAFLIKHLGVVDDDATKTFMKDTLFLPLLSLNYSAWPYGDEIQHSSILDDQGFFNLKIKLTGDNPDYTKLKKNQYCWVTPYPTFEIQTDTFYFQATLTRQDPTESKPTIDKAGIYLCYAAPNPIRFFRTPKVTATFSIITKQGEKETLGNLDYTFYANLSSNDTNQGYNTISKNSKYIHEEESAKDAYLWVQVSMKKS